MVLTLLNLLNNLFLGQPLLFRNYNLSLEYLRFGFASILDHV